MLKKTLLVLLCALCPIWAQAQGRTSNKPIIYLTFDDGPSSDEVTDRILDILEEYDAKATFFVTGLRARANPEKVVKIAAAGHALGNHTQNHSRLLDLPDYQVVDELSETNRSVYAAGGPALSCFRAPFGATDDRVNGIAQRMGLRKVGWTIDTRDWDTYADPDYLAVQLEDSHHGSIILMHDGPTSRWRTLSVFSQWMRDSGSLYDFRVLPDCSEPFEGTFASVDLLPNTLAAANSQAANPKTVEISVVETRVAGRDARAASQQVFLQPVARQSVTRKSVARQVAERQIAERQIAERQAAERKAAERLVAERQAWPVATEETISSLIKKIRNYELSLLPEVVAQTEVTSTTY